MSVTVLTERLGLTGAGIKVFEYNDSNKQRAELHEELWSCLLGCLLACYYEVRKQRNIAHVSPAFSARFFKDIFRDSCIAMSCLALKTMMQMIRLQFKRKRLLLKLSFVCYFIFYVKFHTYEYTVLFSKKIFWSLSPYFNIAFMGKSVSNYVVSTNVAGLWTTYFA